MASEPKDIIRIDNIKLLKVISDPTRKKIIDVLYDKPLTASEISKLISYPKDKIYYHIKILQSNGILIIAESQIVKGITQNKFINAAKKFDIDPTLIGEETPKSNNTPETFSSTSCCFTYFISIVNEPLMISKRSSSIKSIPVSYTHLTLPTNREV